MYREMLKQGFEESIYCDMWPCDRECGKFHKQFIHTTRMRRMHTISESVDHAPQEQENKEKAKGIFEEIMEHASRKDSQQFFERPLPPLPKEFQSMTLGALPKVKVDSTKVDTTVLYYDNPVWDDAKFRQELLDSDDDNFSIGDAPYIMADDDTLDDILRDTQHESASNPIQHYQADETILTDDDDDDNDYSKLDLSKPNPGSFRQSNLRMQKVRSPDAVYEKSLTDL